VEATFVSTRALYLISQPSLISNLTITAVTIYAHPQICQPSQSEPPKALNFAANHLPDIADQPSLWYPFRRCASYLPAGVAPNEPIFQALSLAEQKNQNSSGCSPQFLVVRAASPTKHHQHARRVDRCHGGCYQPPLDHPRGPQRHLGLHQSLRLDLPVGEFLPASRPTWEVCSCCACLSNCSAERHIQQ
jgi:hypothetical protein